MNIENITILEVLEAAFNSLDQKVVLGNQSFTLSFEQDRSKANSQKVVLTTYLNQGSSIEKQNADRIAISGNIEDFDPKKSEDSSKLSLTSELRWDYIVPGNYNKTVFFGGDAITLDDDVTKVFYAAAKAMAEKTSNLIDISEAIEDEFYDDDDEDEEDDEYDEDDVYAAGENE